MQQLRWNSASSRTFRMVCKHWQQAHDMLLPALHINSRHTLMYINASTAITASWQRFKRVTSLVDLSPHYDHGEVTVAGLMAVASALVSLTSLDLSFTGVTAAGLRALAALTALSSLDLRYNEVTDAGVMALAPLTALTSLYLAENEVTDAG
eukprot:2349208-Pyramimonas_sp.AAC.1